MYGSINRIANLQRYNEGWIRTPLCIHLGGDRSINSVYLMERKIERSTFFDAYLECNIPEIVLSGQSCLCSCKYLSTSDFFQNARKSGLNGDGISPFLTFSLSLYSLICSFSNTSSTLIYRSLLYIISILPRQIMRLLNHKIKKMKITYLQDYKFMRL